MKINGSNVTIMVGNMDKGVAFYQSIGLELKQRWDDHYAMLEAPGITIGLHPSEEALAIREGISIGFMVDDINEAKSLLEANAIPFRYEDDGKSGLYLHFSDPYNTVLYFVQPKW